MCTELFQGVTCVQVRRVMPSAKVRYETTFGPHNRLLLLQIKHLKILVSFNGVKKMHS